MNPEELYRLHNAMLTTADAIRRLSPQLGGFMGSGPWGQSPNTIGNGYIPGPAYGSGYGYGYGTSGMTYGGFGESPERMVDPLRERITSLLKERLVEEIRQKAGDALRERVRETVRERVSDAVRTQLWVVGPQIGLVGPTAERISEVLRERISETLRERLEQGLRERIGESLRTRMAETVQERVDEVVRTVLTHASQVQSAYGDPQAFYGMLVEHLGESLRLKLADATRERAGEVVRERVADIVREHAHEAVRTGFTSVSSSLHLGPNTERLAEGVRQTLCDVLPDALRERISDSVKDRTEAVIRERTRDAVREAVRGTFSGSPSISSFGPSMGSGAYGAYGSYPSMGPGGWQSWNGNGSGDPTSMMFGGGMADRIVEVVRQRMGDVIRHQVQDALRSTLTQGGGNTPFGSPFNTVGGTTGQTGPFTHRA